MRLAVVQYQPASMRDGDTIRDRQPKADPTRCAASRWFQPLEWCDDATDVVQRDAGSGIIDMDAHLRVTILHRQDGISRVAHGIVDEIVERAVQEGSVDHGPAIIELVCEIDILAQRAPIVADCGEKGHKIGVLRA